MRFASKLTKYLLPALLALTSALAFAASESTPKLYYTDVYSAPATAPICIYGRNFPSGDETSTAAVVTLDGPGGDCTIGNTGAGLDGAFTSYTTTYALGFCNLTDDCGEACFNMPASSGDCTDTFSVVTLDASNSLPLARHSGTVYYATTSGNDSNDCLSVGNACLTIQGLETKMGLGSGSVGIVGAGTYDDGSYITWDLDGSAVSPVTLRGAHGSLPVFSGGNNDAAGFYERGDYLQLVNVQPEVATTQDVDGKTAFTVYGTGVRAASLVITTANSSCIGPQNSTSDCTVLGSRLDGCGSQYGSPLQQHGHGVYVNGSDDNRIAFNEIANMAAWGVQLYRTVDASLFTDSLVESNWIHDNSLLDTRGGGIVVGKNSRQTIIRNNVIEGNDVAGISLYGDSDEADIYNNTLFENEFEVQFAQDSGNTDFDVVNNIFYNLAGNYFSSSGASLVNVDHNLYWDESAPGADSSPIADNPDFVDSGSLDFHIADSGGAINVGTTPPSSRSVDAELNTAPQGAAQDVGAYEYVSGAGSVCGNSTREGSEECDGSDLGTDCGAGSNEACVCTNCADGGGDCSANHDGGTLACLAGCTFDETGCTDDPQVGVSVR